MLADGFFAGDPCLVVIDGGLWHGYDARRGYYTLSTESGQSVSWFYENPGYAARAAFAVVSPDPYDLQVEFAAKRGLTVTEVLGLEKKATETAAETSDPEPETSAPAAETKESQDNE